MDYSRKPISFFPVKSLSMDQWVFVVTGLLFLTEFKNRRRLSIQLYLFLYIFLCQSQRYLFQ